LSYADLLSYPQESRLMELICIEGWSFTAKWTGPELENIFNDAQIKPEAKTAIFYTADFPSGYSSLDLDYIHENKIIIALKDNDVTLPPDRGFPFQVVAPGKFGNEWVKWVTRIELSSKTGIENLVDSYGAFPLGTSELDAMAKGLQIPDHLIRSLLFPAEGDNQTAFLLLNALVQNILEQTTQPMSDSPDGLGGAEMQALTAPAVSASEVEVFDAFMHPEERPHMNGNDRRPAFRVVGKIKNNSAVEIGEVRLRVSIVDRSRAEAGEADILLNILIPPGATRPFDQEVQVWPPPDWTWTWEVVSVAAKQ